MCTTRLTQTETHWYSFRWSCVLSDRFPVRPQNKTHTHTASNSGTRRAVNQRLKFCDNNHNDDKKKCTTVTSEEVKKGRRGRAAAQLRFSLALLSTYYFHFAVSSSLPQWLRYSSLSVYTCCKTFIRKTIIFQLALQWSATTGKHHDHTSRHDNLTVTPSGPSPMIQKFFPEPEEFKPQRWSMTKVVWEMI
jgi:hypothetical protein